MPAGTHNYYKNREQGKPKIGIKTPLSYLDDGEDTRYGIILRPVKSQDLDFSKFLTDKTPPVTDKDGNTDPQKAKSAVESVSKQAEAAAGTISAKLQPKLTNEAGMKSVTGSFIRLPLPVALRDGLNLQYSQADLGSMGAGLQFGQEVIQAYQDSGSVIDTVKNTAPNAGSYLLRSLIGGVSDAAAAIIQKKLGNIPNPFSVTLFEKVQLRTFNFEWILQPKSPEEAARLREIINQIRYYSLPEVDGLYLNVPYEWEIAFLGTDKLFCFSRCVLENMEVNYSVNGFPVFMEDDAPQTVSLTVTFKEVYPMNKQTLLNGPESMKPNLDYQFQEEQEQEAKQGTEENTVSQNAVFGAREETEKELSSLITSWNAKENELRKIEEILRPKLSGGGTGLSPTDEAKFISQATRLKIDMNQIKTEVDVLHSKLGGSSKSGKPFRALPLR